MAADRRSFPIGQLGPNNWFVDSEKLDPVRAVFRPAINPVYPALLTG